MRPRSLPVHLGFTAEFYPYTFACVVNLTRIPGIVETSVDNILDLEGLSCLDGE